MVFFDRKQAGVLLSERLSDFSHRKDALVLAIPRGGVVVGYELSRSLGLPLNVVVTKKIGAPHNPELAIGAVAEDGEPILDEELVRRLRVSDAYLESATKLVHRKIAEYIKEFRGGVDLEIAGKAVIVTDDGVATGSTMEAALSWLKTKQTSEIILAVPTGAGDSMKRIEKLADLTVVLDKPLWFSAVGQFYREFPQVTDEEVKRILEAN